ncbi:MAG: DUF1786 domain-containing protein [Thermodesulfobacteriota bacterium]
MNILCIDIGSGTQDVLLYNPDRELENCPKFILPSPARNIAAQLQRMGNAGRDVYLYGNNMGGGFKPELKTVLDKGGKVYAHPEAAKALSDHPEKVRSLGVEITRTCPGSAVPLYLSDFDAGAWRMFFDMLGLEQPELTMIAAQDHGYHPEKSNRQGRFGIWEMLLSRRDTKLEDLVFTNPPQEFTRLCTIQAASGGGPVADSGTAAVLGALFVPEIEAKNRERGVCLVGIGNSHTVAFLVYQGRIYGVYEQHTGLLSGEKLWMDLQGFKNGNLTFEQVFADQGHGCLILEAPAAADNFPEIYVIGPQRSILKGYDVHFPAPGGDMMLTGCFGLLKAWENMAS